MTRRTVLAWSAALALIAVLVWITYVRTSASLTPGVISVAGDVRTEVRTVPAPAIPYPSIDPAVGIPATASAGANAKRGGAPVSLSRQPTVSGTIAEMLVSEGDHVAAGQIVARLDTTMLDLGVLQAVTAAKKAHADVAVLGGNIDTVIDAKAKLSNARAKLLDTLDKVLAARSKLAAQLAQLEQLVKHPPGGGAPGGGAPGGGAPGGGAPGGAPNPAVLIPKLKAALAQMDAGIAKLRSGLGQIASGSAKLTDARTMLRNARETLTIVAKGQDLGVQIATLKRGYATITAPVDGNVTFARRPGAVAMVGSPLLRIHPDGPVRVDTYLTGDQLAAVRIGTPAEVTFDSNAGPVLRGKVTLIGTKAQFPPTGFPTSVVHMTRTVMVTITLDPGGAAPPGTPVDITLRTD